LKHSAELPAAALHRPSKKPWNRFKILGARTATRNKFHNETPQISGDILKDLFAEATWNPGLAHPWCKG